MKTLRPEEKRLVGAWTVQNGRVQADEIAKRIDYLTTTVLRKRATSPDGWTVLYEDPNDGRYWELVYPQAEMHGGGPPELHEVSAQEATRKYLLTR